MKRKLVGLVLAVGMVLMGGLVWAESNNERQLKLQALNWEWQYIQLRAEAIQQEAEKLQKEMMDAQRPERPEMPEMPERRERPEMPALPSVKPAE